MLEGLMQNDFQLTVGAIRRRLRACYPHQEVVTLGSEGSTRATYAEVAERVDRLGRVLERLGVGPGERVATFAWNSQRHFELYLAVPSFGAVLHTLNIRLFADQIRYIVGHAEDRVIFVDGSLVEPLAQLGLDGVEHYVVMGDGDLSALPGALSYEALLDEAGDGEYAWPPGSATRAARRATRRASSTRTARCRCTRPPCARPTPSACPRATACSRSCRCSTSTPGACPSRPR
jgi:acyl-CoA synthetase (AMP-forming)/AMP-acid ligase II